MASLPTCSPGDDFSRKGAEPHDETKTKDQDRPQEEEEKEKEKEKETRALVVFGDRVVTHVEHSGDRVASVEWDRDEGEDTLSVPLERLQTASVAADVEDGLREQSEIESKPKAREGVSRRRAEASGSGAGGGAGGGAGAGGYSRPPKRIVKTVSVDITAVLLPVLRLSKEGRQEWTRLVLSGERSQAAELLEEHSRFHPDLGLSPSESPTECPALRRAFESNPRTSVRTGSLIVKIEGLEASLAGDAAREIRTSPTLGCTFVAAATVALFQVVTPKVAAKLPAVLASRAFTADPCPDAPLADVTDFDVYRRIRIPTLSDEVRVMVFELPPIPWTAGFRLASSLAHLIDVARREVWRDDRSFMLLHHNGASDKPLNLLDVFLRRTATAAADEDAMAAAHRWSDHASGILLQALRDHDPDGWESNLHRGGIHSLKKTPFMFLFAWGDIVYEGAKRIVRSCLPRMMEKYSPGKDDPFVSTVRPSRRRSRSTRSSRSATRPWSPKVVMSTVIPPQDFSQDDVALPPSPLGSPCSCGSPLETGAVVAPTSSASASAPAPASASAPPLAPAPATTATATATVISTATATGASAAGDRDGAASDSSPRFSSTSRDELAKYIAGLSEPVSAFKFFTDFKRESPVHYKALYVAGEDTGNKRK